MVEGYVDERVIHWQTFGVTVINPIALGFMLAMGLILLLVPRRFALLPFFLVACLIPDAQRLVIAGVDFTMIRLLLLIAAARQVWRRDYRGLRLGPVDRVFMLWLFLSATVYILRLRGFGDIVYQLGIAFDALGSYFLTRALVRTPDDVESLAQNFAIVALPVAVAMLYEHETAHNLFSVFGGVPATTIIRDGELRCQGAFSHPILAGTYGAVTAPILLGLLAGTRRRRVIAAAGLVAAILIVVLSSSSGPLLSLVFVVIGWATWPLRTQMKLVRRGLTAFLVFIQINMKKPIYTLIGRVSTVTGGTGYHRVQLIDAAIDHFGEWVFLGTNSTAHWGWGLQDITNQYLYEGVNGGLISMIVFIALLVRCYRGIGVARKVISRAKGISRRVRRDQQLVVWGIGVTLLTHCVSFISVSYFGQMKVLWFVFLGLIGALVPVYARATSGQRTTAAAATGAIRGRRLEAPPPPPAGVVAR